MLDLIGIVPKNAYEMDGRPKTAKDRSKNLAGECLLYVGQVARYLQVGAVTVQRLLRSKELIGTRIGRQWRVLQSDLDNYVMANRTRKD